MSKYFNPNYPGPAFQLFGIAHIGALLAIILICLLLAQFKNFKRGSETIHPLDARRHFMGVGAKLAYLEYLLGFLERHVHAAIECMQCIDLAFGLDADL